MINNAKGARRQRGLVSFDEVLFPISSLVPHLLLIYIYYTIGVQELHIHPPHVNCIKLYKLYLHVYVRRAYTCSCRRLVWPRAFAYKSPNATPRRRSLMEKRRMKNIVDYNIHYEMYFSTRRTKTFTVRRLDVRYRGRGSLITYNRIEQVPT